MTSITTKSKILKELVDRQIKFNDKGIGDETLTEEEKDHNSKKLAHRDLRRITEYINTSIFDEHECCIWSGYVTNATNAKRGTYVNFFFKGKKVALHRLLYNNFVEYLGDDSYIKFSCEDQNVNGKCCNINHMIKYKYNSTNIKGDSSQDSENSESCSCQCPKKKTKKPSKDDNNENIEDRLKVIFD
jgi:hypothetical protein